jgi:hypothetical protein
MKLASNARARLLGLALSALLLPSCGQTLQEENPGATLTDPTGSTVLLAETVAMEAAADIQRPVIIMRDVAVPGAGTVRAEVDWTSTEHDIDIIVARDDCRSGIAAWNGDCTLFRDDRSSLTKPARVDFQLAAAGNLRIFVFNFSSAPETATLQVLFR